MPVTCKDVGAFAKQAANPQGARSEVLTGLSTKAKIDLSGAECFNSVLKCAELAGVPWAKNHAELNNDTASILAPPVGTYQVRDQGTMTNMEPGHAIVFYDDKRIGGGKGDGKLRPIHAMISTGGGKAAGSNNDCLDIEPSPDWHELDLGKLAWKGNQVLLRSGRLLTVFHRDITKTEG